MAGSRGRAREGVRGGHTPDQLAEPPHQAPARRYPWLPIKVDGLADPRRTATAESVAHGHGGQIGMKTPQFVPGRKIGIDRLFLLLYPSKSWIDTGSVLSRFR